MGIPSSARVAMISGASRGIGAAIARKLHSEGWSLSIGLRTPASCPVSGPNVLACHFDALDASSEAAWVKATIARFGRLDGLVHNAGIHSAKTVLDATDEEFDKVFAVNVKSPMRLTRHAWPHLAAGGAGRIVIIASLSGKRVKSAGSGLYGMSKFAAVGLAHALRQCGKDAGVRSTAICPSFVATDMASGIGITQPESLTQPADIARVVHLVLELPPTASIAEIPIHWSVEDCF